MINMMYLVLTALLALNVSSEILNAFKTVNNSLQNTNTTVNNSTQTILESLQEKSTEPQSAEKARIWLPKAKQVEGYSKNVYDFIQGLKDRILVEAGGDPKNPTQKFKEDNLDIATHVLVEKGEGKKLYDMLAKYKTDVLSVDPSIKAAFENTLQIDLTKPHTEAKGNSSWEAAYFRMVPTVAALTILSKFQNDVRTSENKIIAHCHEQVGKVIVRFDTYAAIIGQSSNYVMPGQEIEVTAGVGAFSKQAQPNIIIGGKSVPIGEDGAARIKVPTAGMGQHSIPVVINYVDQDGKQQQIKKEIPYTVGQSSASIALDEMNVLYIGYDNKITIAASGGGDDKVSVNIAGGGGSITKTGGGHYIAKVNSVTDDCMINVSVDGKPAASTKFRVRTIPQPVGTIGGYPSGENVPAGAFKAQTGVGAYIKDFPLNLKYAVTSFTLTADNPDGDIEEAPVKGNMFDAKAQGIIRKLGTGRTVTIDEIRAVGPDGRTQKLPSLVYYIK
jgi:gliding motility-associated protein GldM